MAKIGDTIDPNELEDESASQPAQEPQSKIKTAWDYIKGAGKKTIDELEAAGTGATGPFSAVPAGILALEMKAAHGGNLSDRFKQAQQTYANNLNNNVLGGLAGAAISPASKLGGGVAGMALQGASQAAGLGGNPVTGAAIGGGIGTLGSMLGGAVKKAANSEMLSPMLNRLKFLKPSAEEAQPLSESGKDIRQAISDTGAQGMWKGLPSREGMLERFKGAQEPAGQKIGDILNHADQTGAPLPDMNWQGRNQTLGDLLSKETTTPTRAQEFQRMATKGSVNAGSASNLSELNKYKQSLYAQAYEPNTPDMAEQFLPGKDQLLRSMGRDVKGTIQGTLDNLHNIDPSIDAEGFAGANKQYGTLADLIGPLDRATGKEISGGGKGGEIPHTMMNMIGGMFDSGGRRQLAQAHAGEFLQGTTKALTSYKPAQSVARAFVAGNTPGINQEDEENQPQ